jgi:ABC-2 type transport system ATP-binding protein
VNWNMVMRMTPGRSMPVNEPAVVADGLSKRYGRRVVVDSLTFSLASGSISGLLGANGAGKTTTLRLLVGLARPDAGTSRLFGRRYRDLADPLRQVGTLLDSAGYHPGRRGSDELCITARAAGVSEKRVEEVLELVSLGRAGGDRTGAYSTGMRQRLALAESLLGDPPLLLLDEPASGMDPRGRNWLREFLRAQADSGRTVLVSSHILAEVERLVDRVIILDKGRCVADGPLAELLGRAGPRLYVRTGRPDLLAALLVDAGGHVAAAEGGLRIEGLTPERVGDIAAAADVPLYELRPARAQLEDVFLALTGPHVDQHRKGEQ